MYSQADCDWVIRAAEGSNQWVDAIHTPYPTTGKTRCAVDSQRKSTGLFPDVHVDIVPPLLRWFNRVLQQRLLFLLASKFGLAATDLRVKEAVVIRYSRGEKQTNNTTVSCAYQPRTGVPLHRDSSVISLNVLLNPPSQFEGGGTFFAPHGNERDGTTINLQQGDAVLHSGKRLHSGEELLESLFLVNSLTA